MRQETAEEIGQNVLIWMAGQDDLMQVFLGSTGASASDVRLGARDPDFLGAVLDFLMMNDDWVAQFCADHGHAPDVPGRARAALPGGDTVHWT